MNHKVTVCAALVSTITGCNCCQATDSAAPQKKAPPSAQKPQKAVTPDGEVLWVVAEWDACCTPGGNQNAKPCKNAKCWKTKDGRVLCVKPLRKCPKNGKGCNAGEHYHSKAHHCVMCPQEGASAMPQGAGPACNYAAKVVNACPANGGTACKAKEHVNLPGGKKGCSPADQSASPQANKPIEMDDSFEAGEVFEITSSN